MSQDERRYNSEEVARIFKNATEAEATPSTPTDLTSLADGDGLTLAELQDIGQEVGLPSHLVARAAGQLDRPQSGGIERGTLGLPTVVRHTHELPGPLSDEGWERFVVHLRTTFDAAGTLTGEGTLRTWRNGNLAVFLEPTANGHQIRMQTKSALIESKMGGGVGIFVGSLGLGVLGLATGEPVILGLGAAVAAGALGMIWSGFRSAPKWSSLRKDQMEALSGVASRIALDEAARKIE